MVLSVDKQTLTAKQRANSRFMDSVASGAMNDLAKLVNSRTDPFHSLTHRAIAEISMGQFQQFKKTINEVEVAANATKYVGQNLLLQALYSSISELPLIFNSIRDKARLNSDLIPYVTFIRILIAFDSKSDSVEIENLLNQLELEIIPSNHKSLISFHFSLKLLLFFQLDDLERATNLWNNLDGLLVLKLTQLDYVRFGILELRHNNVENGLKMIQMAAYSSSFPSNTLVNKLTAFLEYLTLNSNSALAMIPKLMITANPYDLIDLYSFNISCLFDIEVNGTVSGKEDIEIKERKIPTEDLFVAKIDIKELKIDSKDPNTKIDSKESKELKESKDSKKDKKGKAKSSKSEKSKTEETEAVSETLVLPNVDLNNRILINEIPSQIFDKIETSAIALSNFHAPNDFDFQPYILPQSDGEIMKLEPAFIDRDWSTFISLAHLISDDQVMDYLLRAIDSHFVGAARVLLPRVNPFKSISQQNDDTIANFAIQKGNLEIIRAIYDKRYKSKERVPGYPLVSACRTGNIEIVKYFLDKGESMKSENPDDKDGFPIHAACRSGSVKLVKDLIQNNPRENLPHLNRLKESWLHCAARGRDGANTAMIEFLTKPPPLHLKDKVPSVQPIQIAFETKRTALDEACTVKYAGNVQALISSMGDKYESGLRTSLPSMLKIAAEYGSLAVLKYLRSRIEFREEDRAKAIEIALNNSNALVVNFLLDPKDKDEKPLSAPAVKYSTVRDLLSSIYLTKEEEFAWCVEYAASKINNDEVNRKDDKGSSLLHMASSMNSRWAVDILLYHGARVDARDGQNHFPIQLSKNWDVINSFQSHHKDPKAWTIDFEKRKTQLIKDITSKKDQSMPTPDADEPVGGSVKSLSSLTSAGASGGSIPTSSHNPNRQFRSPEVRSVDAASGNVSSTDKNPIENYNVSAIDMKEPKIQISRASKVFWEESHNRASIFCVVKTQEGNVLISSGVHSNFIPKDERNRLAVNQLYTILEGTNRTMELGRFVAVRTSDHFDYSLWLLDRDIEVDPKLFYQLDTNANSVQQNTPVFMEGASTEKSYGTLMYVDLTIPEIEMEKMMQVSANPKTPIFGQSGDYGSAVFGNDNQILGMLIRPNSLESGAIVCPSHFIFADLAKHCEQLVKDFIIYSFDVLGEHARLYTDDDEDDQGMCF